MLQTQQLRGESVHVALIHGFACDHALWGPTLSHLERGIGALGVLLPGHGPEPVPCGSFDDVAQALKTQMDRHPSATFVGYSLGARVLLAAVAAGAKNRCLAIGPRLGLSTLDAKERRRAQDAEWAALLRANGLPFFAERWAEHPTLRSPHLSPQAVALSSEMRLRHTAGGLADALDTLGLAEMPDLRGALPQIKARVRFAFGVDDTAFHDTAAELERAGCAVQRVDGAGHNVPLCRPDAVAIAIGDVGRGVAIPD